MTRVTLRGLGICLGVALFALAAAPEAQSAVHRPEVVEGDGTRAQGFFTAGANGAVIALPGQARLVLEPGTTLRVFGAAQQLRMPAGYHVATWSVAVRNGHVRAVVDKPKQSAVLLTASEEFSTVVAQGKGALIVDAAGYTAANLGGTSHTVVNGRWIKLEPNAQHSVERGGGKLVTKPMLPQTKLLPGQRVWISTRQAAALGGFKWQPLEAAKSYTVKLTRSGETEPLSTVTTTETELTTPLGPVNPGQYELRVRANDDKQLPGQWSEKVELRVVGVELPEGAYVSDTGDIHLGRGQRARFTNTDGLELTYSGAHRYVPASSEVPLQDNRRTMVSFRQPGSLDVAVARLQPRNVTAEVEIGPKTASWPRDAVEIAIRLRAPQGGAAPEFIEPRPKVTVGIDPIDVSWRWDGSVLRGTVPPQESDGPWVVRVEVEDQFGLPLGRDLLEVVPNRAVKKRPARRAPSPERISRNDD